MCDTNVAHAKSPSHHHITGQSSNSPARASLMMYVITPNIGRDESQLVSSGIASTIPFSRFSRCGLGCDLYFFTLNSPSMQQTSSEPSHTVSEQSMTSSAPLMMPVARRFFLHQNAINFALPEGAKKTHSAQCKNERKECLLMLLLSRITFVESRQADSIFESYITM